MKQVYTRGHRIKNNPDKIGARCVVVFSLISLLHMRARILPVAALRVVLRSAHRWTKGFRGDLEALESTKGEAEITLL